MLIFFDAFDTIFMRRRYARQTLTPAAAPLAMLALYAPPYFVAASPVAAVDAANARRHARLYHAPSAMPVSALKTRG
jgi:hypothetical protein